DFWQPWLESYADMDDRHSRFAARANDAPRSTQELVLRLCVNRHDTGLAIHRKQRGPWDLKPWSDAHRAASLLFDRSAVALRLTVEPFFLANIRRSNNAEVPRPSSSE